MHNFQIDFLIISIFSKIKQIIKFMMLKPVVINSYFIHNYGYDSKQHGKNIVIHKNN